MQKNLIEGRLQGNERGYAFLIVGDGKEDYFIPHSDLRGAMHGDTVLAERTHGEGARTTARVLKVISRGITEIVGTYFSVKSGGFVCPDDKRYYSDVFIPFGKGERAKSGDKVVCKILSYPKRQSPEGIIKKVLGRQFNKQAELKSILYSFNLPERFPKSVIEKAESLSKVSENDFIGRADYRLLKTLTIDGADARDFDDAISIETNKNGDYVLGVHIADVSHYVRHGDEIDKEAFNRGTSVYFPESVIPMLPEKLCNDLCSLVQGEDRLTLSCVMTISDSGKVKDYIITPSVIKSDARLTYDVVQSILDGDKSLTRKHGNVVKELRLMDKLADILIKKRDEDGSIDLDVKESTIFMDKGEIVVQATKRDKAHRIIEEFMILANCTVAEYMFFLEKPFVYRVHGQPTEERLDGFYEFLNGIGISTRRRREKVNSKEFQQILKKTENTPAYTLINRVMLRSMQKAKYSPTDIGHFGLSLSHYCHFTSPIRRYPDLIVHRILKDFLSGQADVEEKYGEFVFEAAEKASETERNAIEAERAVDDYYKILYMSGHVGEEFSGIVSGVMPFGIFVELSNGIEGLIKIENLPLKRNFVCDKKTYTLTDGKTTFKLGQTVKITVAGVNYGDRRAEFVLA